MKKRIVVILSLVFVLALGFSLIGCSEGVPSERKQGLAYDIAYDDNIVEAYVVVDVQGNFYDVKIDEIFKLVEAMQVPSGFNVSGVETFNGPLNWGSPTVYAKYLQVGDRLVEGKYENNVISVKEIAEKDAISDMIEYYKTDVGKKEYYEAATRSKITYVKLKAEQTEYNKETVSAAGVATTANGNIRKSLSTYWEGANRPLGWKGNMRLLEMSIIAYGNEGTESIIAKTSATLDDKNPYLKVVMQAKEIALKA